MQLSDFDYDLPNERIAHEPARPRDASRMMTLDRTSGVFTDSLFKNLPAILQAGDVLVFNDTRVIRARLYGQLERRSGTVREIEVLFVNRLAESTWEVMCKPGRRIHPGDRIVFQAEGDTGTAEGRFGEAREHALRLLEIQCSEPFDHFMEKVGHIPLPPYIERADTETDRVEYQTMFARMPGAIAAPTAGLHFTPEILTALKARGVQTTAITLHVGIGTFQPVRDSDPRLHRLLPERFSISEETAQILNQAKEDGRRIIAVGTTATRTMEYAIQDTGRFQSGEGQSDIYILPGYRFRAINGLLTNFHLPKSTLLMLVSAFASRDHILQAYRHAIAAHYRFYSYGDCMLIV